MGLPPGPHPRHVVAAAEVLGVLRLLPPRLLAGGLAHLAAGRLDAVALPAAIARVGHEELSAMQALARSARMHRPASKLRLRRSTHLRSRGPGTGIRGEEKPRKEEDSSLSNEGRRSTQEEVTSCPPETEHFMPAAYRVVDADLALGLFAWRDRIGRGIWQGNGAGTAKQERCNKCLHTGEVLPGCAASVEWCISQ